MVVDHILKSFLVLLHHSSMFAAAQNVFEMVAQYLYIGTSSISGFYGKVLFPRSC